MNSNIHKIENDDDTQRFHHLKTEQPSSTEETITTIEKKVPLISNEMTSVSKVWEKCPIKRPNLISGPKSAFARLFPEKYRQQEEHLTRTQRSKSNDHRYISTDHVIPHRTRNDDDDDNNNNDVHYGNCPERIRRSRRVKFYNHEDNSLRVRATSDPYLDRLRLSSEYCNDDMNYDLSPKIIHRNNPHEIVYTQKVGVRYLRPPTPPPSGPIVIREIQPTPPHDLPPLVVSGTPPIPPRTPSPLIVREKPPTPPAYQPTKVITKRLPLPPIPPRRVIIKRKPPLPAKPRPVIIEKWLPYKPPPERPIVYERAEKIEQTRPVHRNVILQYDPPRVQIKQEIQNFGCFRVDPKAYRAQYGPSLRRTDEIRKVLENIGCNADLITSTGYNSCFSSSSNQRSNFSHYDYPRQSTTCFTDEQLDALIGTAIPNVAPVEHHYDTPKIYNDDEEYDIRPVSKV